MAFSVSYKSTVARDLARLDKSQARRILARIEKDLAQKAGTYPVLKGKWAGLRKFCVGDYRVIYALLKEEAIILRIAHRRDVYR